MLPPNFEEAEKKLGSTEDSVKEHHFLIEVDSEIKDTSNPKTQFREHEQI